LRLAPAADIPSQPTIPAYFGGMPRAEIRSKQAIFTLSRLHAELAGKFAENRNAGVKIKAAMMQVREIYMIACGGVDMPNFHYLPPSPFLTETNWSDSFCTCSFEKTRVDIDHFLSIDVGKACEEVKPRVNLYAGGLERVEENDAVLGGGAIFKDSRISVLHIGKMADRGESMENILEDYPNLTEGDVNFAKLYYKARPPVGRPRSNGAADVKTSTE